MGMGMSVCGWSEVGRGGGCSPTKTAKPAVDMIAKPIIVAPRTAYLSAMIAQVMETVHGCLHSQQGFTGREASRTSHARCERRDAPELCFQALVSQANHDARQEAMTSLSLWMRRVNRDYSLCETGRREVWGACQDDVQGQVTAHDNAPTKKAAMVSRMACGCTSVRRTSCQKFARCVSAFAIRPSRWSTSATYALSSFVRNQAVVGEFGSSTKHARPNTQVNAPSCGIVLKSEEDASWGARCAYDDEEPRPAWSV